MQLQLGTFTFNANACEVTSQTSVIRSYYGRPLRWKMAIHVKAYLETTLGQAACTALEIALRAACLVPYQSLILKHDDGSPSSTAVVSNSSISGVVITDGPHFGEAMDAEYVNRRTAEFSGEAEFVIQNTAAAIVSFSESVSITGDAGPVNTWRQSIKRRPSSSRFTRSRSSRRPSPGRPLATPRTRAPQPRCGRSS